MIMETRNVNTEPWNVNWGLCSVSMGPWNVNKDLECDYGTVECE